MANLLNTYQSWKTKFNNPDALVFFKKNFQAYLGFQKEFLSSNDEAALDTPSSK